MTIGMLIILGLIAGEVVALTKVSRQNERIEKLEKQIVKQKKKES